MSSPISGRSIVSSSTTISFRSRISGFSTCLRLNASSCRVSSAARSVALRISSRSERSDEPVLGVLERERRVAADRGQHVVEVVRDAAGEAADRLQLLALPQLLLELLLAGHVLGHRDHVGRLAVRVADERGCEVHVHRAPVLRHEQRPRAGRRPGRREPAPRTSRRRSRGRPDARGRRASARGAPPRCSPGALRASGSRAITEPSTPTSIIAVGADSNIVRNRSSLSRSSATVESERCASASGAIRAGRSQGLNSANAPTATPSPASTNSIPSAGRGEEAALAERVPAAEPQHDREQQVIEGDEDGRGEQAGEGERGVARRCRSRPRQPRRRER